LGLTPFGYLPKECIHYAPSGSVVEEKSFLTNNKEQGLVIQHPSGDIVEIKGKCPRQGPPALPSGWAAYTEWLTTTAIQNYGAVWPVPPVPRDKAADQVIFLFSGLQNTGPTTAGPVTIIQPVLQFGQSEAGGGAYWAIASWFVSATGHALYTDLSTVSAGDIIVGNMTNDAGMWSIAAVDNNNNAQQTLHCRTNEAEKYCTVTLEVYSITSCLDFPTGGTTFSSLIISDASGVVTPVWSPQVQPGCQEAVTVENAQTVTLKF